MDGRLQVTIVTGTSAGLAGLLCARLRALGLPVVRYRQDGNLLLRSHGGERAAVPAGRCATCALRAEVTDFLTGLPGGRLLLVLPETADPLGIALAADAAGITIQTAAMIADLGSVARDLAGGETLAGRGLAAAPAEPIRRTAASFDWHPEHGDRRSEIRFTGAGLLSHELCAALDRAVLTGPEMARGEQAWARLADPFSRWPAPPPRDEHPADEPPRPVGDR